MIIKKVSTEQFAGIRNKEIALNEGLNVVFGKNEAGKSTLVNVISRTLFQNAKINGQTDRDFKSRFFPDKKSGVSGDTVYGTLVISTSDGDYKLEKTWNPKSPSIKLDTPTGIVTDPDTVTGILRDILGFGEGVYTELLLSPQKDAPQNLQRLLENSLKSDTKEAISNAVSEAFSVGGAMTYEEFEDAVNAKIARLVGKEKYWDSGSKKVKPHSQRLKIGIKDSVIEAFYAWEDAKDDCDAMTRLEAALENAEAGYLSSENVCAEAERELEDFKKFAKLLKLNEVINELKSSLEKYTADKAEWERSSEILKTAVKLRRELEAHRVLESFNAIKKLRLERDSKQAELEKASAPDASEIKDAVNAEKLIEAQQGKLGGMNAAVNIRMLGEYSVTVRSARTGEELDINAPITEAAIIGIPGVMEMELAPAGVDIEAVNAEIAALKSQRDGIFGKYGAASVEALRELKDNYDALAREAKLCAEEYSRALGGRNYDELASEAGALNVLRSRSDVESDIQRFCGSDIAKHIEDISVRVRSFEHIYGSPEALAKRISDTAAELELKKRSVTAPDGEIPEKYRGITNAEAYLDELERKKENAESSQREAWKKKSEAEFALGEFTKARPDDLADVLEERKRAYNERVAELENWTHILEVFNKLKAEEQNDPLEKLTEKFRDNLSKISDNSVTAELSEPGRLDLEITGGGNRLDFGKLSEGTKETVYLAFRLAVLDHLFPNGGGIIVLDDPLNDMDKDRVKSSCELIKEYSERHQIILMTCREEYCVPLDVKPNDIKRIEAIHAAVS